MGAWIEIQYGTSRNVDEYDVAPHDGCVDWNCYRYTIKRYYDLSHPTMGAWIEIFSVDPMTITEAVAPHDGCVDWNRLLVCQSAPPRSSHPTMGAWIEIQKGGVKDGNRPRRTPRWVRGLKYNLQTLKLGGSQSHPTMGAWIEIWLHLSDTLPYSVAPHDGCVDWN